MRTIKSFVLRAGRTSPRQQTGLDSWLPAYLMPPLGQRWDFPAIFGREAPVLVEIGFGMGGSLTQMAQARPDLNFIGIEVHRAGIGSLAADLHDLGIGNVRIAPLDAVEVFTQCIPDESLAMVQIFFPDPWPKKRHHKRRLVQSEFIQLVIKKIKIEGQLHCATDWQEYAEHMLSVLSAEPNLANLGLDSGYSPRPETRPLTKFEQRGQRLGHGVWDLLFKRVHGIS